MRQTHGIVPDLFRDEQTSNLSAYQRQLRDPRMVTRIGHSVERLSGRMDGHPRVAQSVSLVQIMVDREGRTEIQGCRGD